MVKLNPLTAHVHDAGFAPKSDERIASVIGGMERGLRGRVNRATRGPREKSSDQLPPEFMDPAVGRVEWLLRQGNWQAAKAAIDAIEREWPLWQAEHSSLASLPEGQRLALHINRLHLPQRTIGTLESMGIFTLGALVESFPAKLYGAWQCGHETVKAIAKALVSAGLLSSDKAAAKVGEWEAREWQP